MQQQPTPPSPAVPTPGAVVPYAARRTAAPGARVAIPRAAWRTAWGGAIGNFIEQFDYLLFGSMIVFFAPSFFPSDDPAASFLAALAVLGAGYFARPLGAIIFGAVGDRRGRRTVLVWTVSLMGVCSGLIGILPTYAEIGLWAPILLTMLRLCQGISGGAEQQGAVTYVLESAPPSRRGFLASFTPMGAAAGSFAGLVLVLVLGASLGPTAMADYGWRIPFLITIPLAFVVVWIRAGLEDSPEFLQMAARNEIVQSPLRATVRSHWRTVLLAAGIAIGVSGTAGLVLWFSTYLAGSRGLPESTVFSALAVGAFVAIGWAPLSGRLTDRFGRKRMTAGVLIAFAVLAVPLLWLLSTATSFVVIALVVSVYNSMAVLLSPPAYSLMSEIFPREVRATGSTVGVNIGAVLGIGLAPLVAAQLTRATGSAVGVAIWIVVVVLLGLLSLRFVAETGDEPLR